MLDLSLHHVVYLFAIGRPHHGPGTDFFNSIETWLSYPFLPVVLKTQLEPPISLRFYRAVERVLARHLGGRVSPVTADELWIGLQ